MPTAGAWSGPLTQLLQLVETKLFQSDHRLQNRNEQPNPVTGLPVGGISRTYATYRLRAFIAARVSRSTSFLRIASRLSCACLPLARLMAILALPFLK